MLAAEPDALDVDGLSQIPDLLGCVDSVCINLVTRMMKEGMDKAPTSIIGVHDSCVVEHDVDAASSVHVLDQRSNIGLLANIANLVVDLVGDVREQTTELVSGFDQSRSRYVGHEDVGALSCEQNTCFETNATVTWRQCILLEN